jgi:hypothetical protein
MTQQMEKIFSICKNCNGTFVTVKYFSEEQRTITKNFCLDCGINH